MVGPKILRLHTVDVKSHRCSVPNHRHVIPLVAGVRQIVAFDRRNSLRGALQSECELAVGFGNDFIGAGPAIFGENVAEPDFVRINKRLNRKIRYGGQVQWTVAARIIDEKSHAGIVDTRWIQKLCGSSVGIIPWVRWTESDCVGCIGGQR
jgi:hypothetical protein